MRPHATVALGRSEHRDSSFIIPGWGMEEVEVKYRLGGDAEHERLRGRLRALGAEPTGEVREENRMYRDADGRLAASRSILRLRILDGGPGGRLTFKGPARYDGPVKSRREIETGVADAEALHLILESIAHALTYHKDRETWQAGAVEVALDTLEFGHFCELEGPADAIRALATGLDLTDAQAEPSGYPTLMERSLKGEG
jgi:adenylate cyclase, class 2